MAQAVLEVDGLPDAALDAAQHFYAERMEQARAQLASGAENLAIVLPIATHDHADWRRALARDLARAHAPQRVNVIAGEKGEGLAATLAFLDETPAITGQFLVLAQAAEQADV